MRISDWSSDVCSSDLPETGAIFDSNRYTIHALLTGLGCQVDDLGILPDRLDVVREALAQAEGRHDLLVTSGGVSRSEEHTSELQSLMRISYAVFCLKKKK